MTYERLIHDYLDEGLSETMQESLFSELAKNSELRYEFNKQMKLQQMAKDNFETSAPPVELTNKIFTSAGFSAPYSSIPGFKISYLFALIPLVFLTVGIMNYDNINSFFESNNEVKLSKELAFNQAGNALLDNSSTLEKEDGVETIITYPIDDPSIKVSGSSVNSNRNSIRESNNFDNGNIASNSIISSANERNNVNNINFLHEMNMDYEGKPFFYISSSDIATDNVIIREVRNEKIQNSLQNSNLNNSFVVSNEYEVSSNKAIGPDNTKFSLSARAINNSSLYKSENLSNVPIANYAVNLAYKHNKNYAFFLEFSNENYFQEFQNINSEGVTFQTRQNPTLMVLSAGMRYTLKDIFNSNKIYPFIQAGVGFSTVGAVSKLATGLEIRLTNNISFVPSYEFAGLFYQNQLGNYTSWNNGFSLGMSYNFWE